MDEKDIATETEEVVEDVEDVTDEVAEDVADEAKEPTVEDDGFDIDDLEYDENGDVIIPEEEGDKEISEEKEETSKAEDERDSKIKSLEERLAELTSRSKDTLKALGIESEDVLDGLAALTAETEGISVEEYLARRTEAKKATIKSQADFEAVAAADLAALQATFPETKNYKHIKDMPKEILAEFAKNRDLGLPAVKAYAAANVDGIRASTVASVKAEKSGKEHLQSAAPKGAKSTAIKMSRNELNEWRGLFPGMSDRDIVALYRKTAKK